MFFGEFAILVRFSYSCKMSKMSDQIKRGDIQNALRTVPLAKLSFNYH